MRKILLAFIFVFLAFAAGAQVQFGIKAGVNIANITTSGLTFVPGASYSTRTDFNGGVLVSIPLFSDFFLQPELNYSGQGESYSNPIANGTLNYSYLNIPVLFKYQHRSGLFAETGPQIGFLLAAKAVANGATYDQNAIESTDFTWAFGIGYKLHPIPLGLDLRYNLGLTNIYKNSGSATAKNSVFQIDVFYLFSLK
jgi:hypothetical protein